MPSNRAHDWFLILSFDPSLSHSISEKHLSLFLCALDSCVKLTVCYYGTQEVEVWQLLVLYFSTTLSNSPLFTLPFESTINTVLFLYHILLRLRPYPNYKSC